MFLPVPGCYSRSSHLNKHTDSALWPQMVSSHQVLKAAMVTSDLEHRHIVCSWLGTLITVPSLPGWLGLSPRNPPEQKLLRDTFSNQHILTDAFNFLSLFIQPIFSDSSLHNSSSFLKRFHSYPCIHVCFLIFPLSFLISLKTQTSLALSRTEEAPWLRKYWINIC